MRLPRRSRSDNDLVEEIDTHLALIEDEYRRAGMSDDDARHAAQRRLGGVLKTRQVYREQRRWHGIDVFTQDVRIALRLLAHNRGYTLTLLSVLGLGIGVNNMMFTIIYGHTLRGLPIEARDRVLMASYTDERGATRPLSTGDFEDIRTHTAVFGHAAAFGPSAPVALGDRDRAPDRQLATYVTSDAFATLGIAPVLGRSFTNEDDRPGRPPIVILGGAAWRNRYASNPALLGKDVLIDGRPTTVVGIIPERSGFPTTAEVWLPAVQAPGYAPNDREARTLRFISRVRDGISVEQARTELETLLNGAAARLTPPQKLRATVSPISDAFFGSPFHPAWMAFITSGFLVLIVSCANVANLMLARGMQRTRELAIRGALGASRARVFAQLLAESALLAALGGLIGLPLSMAGVRIFASFIPPDALPYWIHYQMDATVAGALVAVAFGAILLFGLLPALQASKTDVIRVLRDGGWTTGRRRAWQWTTAFMTVQIGLTVVLLRYGVTGWLDNVPPPRSDAIVATTDVLTASVSLSGERFRSSGQRADFYRQTRERLLALPGVAGVSLASHLPNTGAIEQRLQVAAETTFEQLPRVWTLSLAPAYFQTLRLSVLRGREFADGDAAGSEPVAIVNERFVSLFSSGEDPIGRRISLQSANAAGKPGTPATIVGVVEDVRQQNSAALDPLVYFPLASTAPTTVFMLIRGTIASETMTAQLREAMLGLDPNLPVFRVQTLQRVVRDADWNRRVSNLLVTALQIIVLALSAIGLYAVTSQAVHQRTKELGIRIAIGARPSALRRLVLKRAAVQVAFGLLFGILGMMAWDSAFFAEGVDRRFARPEVLMSIVAILTAIMGTACLIPIGRATRLNPVAALRQD
jgi:putative ABC transport system permease protein